MAAVSALLGVAAYAGLCAWFAAHEREMIYTLGGPRSTPAEAGAAWLTAVDIHTDDGERLDGWWSPPPPGRGVVIFFHGTPSTLADTVWHLNDLAQAGFGVLAIDYRGYGGSTGRPSEEGLRADARAAFDFARTAAPQAPIAVFGESLGTGVAVNLARERSVAGVLLNSPFASIADHFAVHLPPLPYRLLLTQRFDSEGQIAEIGAPVMILAGTADDVTVIGEARRLFIAAREPKRMIEVGGAGHCAAWSGDAKVAALAALADWTKPRSRSAGPD
jgi:alpha-beta hydrolase superfamily lysophospholipase